MSATTVGGLIGAAIDELTGHDPAEGAIEGAIVANVLKVVVPLALTYAVGWTVLRGATGLKNRVFPPAA